MTPGGRDSSLSGATVLELLDPVRGGPAVERPRPEAPRMKVRDLIRMLEADGWRRVRMRGSHRQFQHPTKRGTVTVAGYPSVEMPPWILYRVLRQAGLNKERS